MKLKRVTRLFSILIILTMLLVALPATPVLAAYDIEIDPEEGAIGTEVTIVGEDFDYSEDYERYVRVYFSSDEADEGDLIYESGTGVSSSSCEVFDFEIVESWEEIDEDDDGSFEITFEVPAELTDGDDDVDVESGTYYIYCTVTSETASNISTYIRAAVEFEVIGGEIEIDEDEGIVGTLVEITGTGFPSEEDIAIEYHDGSTTVDVDIEDGDDETDDDGDFETVIRIPESTSGDHTLTVTVDNSEAEVEFTVVPDVLLSSQSGKAGDSITVSGTGFAKRGEIEIWFNDNIGVATDTASSTGTFDATFTVPSGLSASIYDVDVEDGTSTATAKFTLTVEPSSTTPEETEPEETEPETTEPETTTSSISLTASPTSGKVNDLVTLIGMGFTPSSQIVIKYAGENIATTTTTTEGVFSAAFYVPSGTGSGAQTITVTDGTNTGTTTFTVETTAPVTPQPLSPEMGARAKSPATFDWEDVTDDSLPVTYELQIATDEEFENVVLEKSDIAESTYSLTEEEELELASQETAYYWRIRAVDGASNASVWTGANEFYVAGSFNFPKWAIYTLLVFGAVIIFGVGYWLGRRTAFYY